mgnify:CR=1 FL=1
MGITARTTARRASAVYQLRKIAHRHRAIVGGVGTLSGRPCLVLGHQKGRDTKENVLRNFGCAHPEGYRKAMRLMQMAEKFHLPIVIFIDTPGAYPGVGAEQRGQAEAIAVNLREMSRLRTPIISVVIGEGGSGGALGIGGQWVGGRRRAGVLTGGQQLTPAGMTGRLEEEHP